MTKLLDAITNIMAIIMITFLLATIISFTIAIISSSTVFTLVTSTAFKATTSTLFILFPLTCVRVAIELK